MIKIQCPEIKKGENVHEHYCFCCKGKQHITFAIALKYQLSGLLILSDDGKSDASDYEMHERINYFINYYKNKYKYNGIIEFERFEYGEPLSTLNACINSLRFYK